MIRTCTWCGHEAHADACPRRIETRTWPGRPAKPIDTTIPCPCLRRTS